MTRARLALPVALPVALAALVSRPAASAPPPRPADPPADGFDHISHQGRVVSRALAPPPCSRCHQLASGGRLGPAPGHAACFGDCHGPLPRRAGPYPADAASRQVCHACHRPAQIARLERGTRGRISSAFPPYDRDRDFAMTMSHAAHARVERGCRACHGAPPEPGPATAASAPRATSVPRNPARPHARCIGCHERGRAVGMDRCTSCHTPAVGPARAPLRDPGLYPVRSRFSHRRHLSRIGGAGDPCRACHAGAAAESGERVPTPKKQHCRACHDGTRAFSMVAPTCRRCHGPPERAGGSTELPRSRFSHLVHVSRPGLTCATCHAIDASGAPVSELRGHSPCSDTGCHADDFAAAAPVTCGVCHVRGDPWRELHADSAPVDTTEFGVDFSHRAHLGTRPPLVAAPCARCHRPAAGGRFQPSFGHDTCAGARCHAPSAGGASPPLSRCSACHTLGLANRHEQSRLGRRWSVRERFTHVPHASEPARERPVPCIECHTAALSSQRLADMTTPRKQTCARCHDGRAAFKLTGHTCGRCHVSPAPVRTATGSRSGTGPPAPPR